MCLMTPAVLVSGFVLVSVVVATIYIIATPKYKDTFLEALGATLIGLSCAAQLGQIVQNLDSHKPLVGIVIGALIFVGGFALKQRTETRKHRNHQKVSHEDCAEHHQ